MKNVRLLYYYTDFGWLINNKILLSHGDLNRYRTVILYLVSIEQIINMNKILIKDIVCYIFQFYLKLYDMTFDIILK